MEVSVLPDLFEEMIVRQLTETTLILVDMAKLDQDFLLFSLIFMLQCRHRVPGSGSIHTLPQHASTHLRVRSGY